MEYGGMVHALEEIHRLLRAGGRLIDIHPVLEVPLIKVFQGGRVLFAEPDPDFDNYKEDVRQAEAALAQIVQRGLFVIERSGEFDSSKYASSVAELRDSTAKASAYNDSPPDEAVVAREAELYARAEQIMQAAGEGAEVAIHEKGHIARLKPVR
jgi:hypothetical protein